MLDSRERKILEELERQFDQEDHARVRAVAAPANSYLPRLPLLLTTATAVLAVLSLLAIVAGVPAASAVFAAATIVLIYVHDHLPAVSSDHPRPAD